MFTGAIPVAAPVAGGDVAWTIPVYIIHSDKDEIVSHSAAKRHAAAVKGKGAKLEFKTVTGLLAPLEGRAAFVRVEAGALQPD